MRPVKAVAGIGAFLTCPCHAVPLLLLLGGTAGSAWIARHLPALVIALGIVFLVSLWLLLRPDQRASGRARDITASPSGT
jgi:hypothetical protein